MLPTDFLHKISGGSSLDDDIKLSILFPKEDLRYEEEHSRSYLANSSHILMENGTSTTRVLHFFKKKFLCEVLVESEL